MNYRSSFPLVLIFVSIFTSSNCTAPDVPISKERGALSPKALFQGPQIYITVSPDAGYRYNTEANGNMIEFLDRMLVLHWLNFNIQSGDEIGLYSRNPEALSESNAASYLLEQHPVSSSSGKVKTSVRYNRIPLDPDMNPCLGFWVAYTRRGSNGKAPIQSKCLMIYPTWMNDIQDKIKNVPIRSLMIPGTHDAGAWIYYAGLGFENPYTEYTFCQEDTIYDQLMNGIRSLDVRVGYYKATGARFYINHDTARLRPLSTLLEDVRKFVEETNEIVFLDFHNFPMGFDSQEAHDLLVDFVRHHLEFLLVPKSATMSVTPGKIWEKGQNVILFYSNVATVAKHDITWPGINQAWANTTKLSDLESYLATSISKLGCSGTAWSAMAELTSTVQDAIQKPSFGVRGYANISNDAVSNWYQRESWYSRSMIVALDFYRSTNVIETAIEVNKNNANVCN